MKSIPSTRTSLGLAAIVLVLSIARGADAQVSDDDRAHSHFLAGSSYFDQRRYLDAAHQFEEAYELSGRIALLLNIATSYEHADHPGDAADALERWLELAPANVPDRRTQTIRLEQLRAAAAEQEARARALAAAAPPGTSPGGSVDESGLGGLGVTGIVLLGAGGAIGVVSLGTGLAANARQNELEAGCTADRVCPASLESTRNRGRRLATTSTVTTVASVVSLGAGAALLVIELLGDDDEAPVAAGTVRWIAGPGDVGVGLGLAF